MFSTTPKKTKAAPPKRAVAESVPPRTTPIAEPDTALARQTRGAKRAASASDGGRQKKTKQAEIPRIRELDDAAPPHTPTTASLTPNPPVPQPSPIRSPSLPPPPATPTPTSTRRAQPETDNEADSEVDWPLPASQDRLQQLYEARYNDNRRSWSNATTTSIARAIFGFDDSVAWSGFATKAMLAFAEAGVRNRSEFVEEWTAVTTDILAWPEIAEVGRLHSHSHEVSTSDPRHGSPQDYVYWAVQYQFQELAKKWPIHKRVQQELENRAAAAEGRPPRILSGGLGPHVVQGGGGVDLIAPVTALSSRPIAVTFRGPFRETEGIAGELCCVVGNWVDAEFGAGHGLVKEPTLQEAMRVVLGSCRQFTEPIHPRQLMGALIDVGLAFDTPRTLQRTELVPLIDDEQVRFWLLSTWLSGIHTPRILVIVHAPTGNRGATQSPQPTSGFLDPSTFPRYEPWIPSANGRGTSAAPTEARETPEQAEEANPVATKAKGAKRGRKGPVTAGPSRVTRGKRRGK